MKRSIVGFPFLLGAANLFAQRNSPSPSYSPSAEDAAAVAGAAGVGLACCVVYVLMIAVSIGAWIFTAIWIMKDARSRNSESESKTTRWGFVRSTMSRMERVVSLSSTSAG